MSMFGSAPRMPPPSDKQIAYQREAGEIRIRKWAIEQAMCLEESERASLGGLEAAAKVIEAYVRG